MRLGNGFIVIRVYLLRLIENFGPVLNIRSGYVFHAIKNDLLMIILFRTDEMTEYNWEEMIARIVRTDLECCPV